MSNYSFCLFRIPENGRRVLWEITNICNYSCSYCIFSAQSKKMDGELTTDEVFKTLKGLKANNYTHIKITGGEPFVRNDLLKILKKAVDLGFEIDVSTNGSFITPEKAQEIKKINLKMVHVSLDGHNAKTHELVRGVNTFERTIRGIRNLVENDIYVRIGTVIYKENENNIEDIVRLVVNLGVNEIIFSFMEPVGRMKDDYTLVSNRDIQGLKSEIENISDRYKHIIKVSYSFTEEVDSCEEGNCPGGSKFLYIDNLGRVSPCTWVAEVKQSFISDKTLKEYTVNEIIESISIKSFLSYIDSLKSKNIKGCPVKRR